jgi:hypothetical protein
MFFVMKWWELYVPLSSDKEAKLFMMLLFIYLFIHGFFNDIVSISDCIVSNGRMMANNELEKMWKKEVMASFDLLPQHLPGGTEENH